MAVITQNMPKFFFGTSFDSFNQFDKRFSEFGNFDQQRSACPLFALITCKKFLDNNNISQEQYEKNLYTAINNYITQDMPKYMSFEILMKFCNSKNKEIGATTPELIENNIIGYEQIFKLNDKAKNNYCVMFLKNSNFIVITVLHNTNYNSNNNNDSPIFYSVRDCHEKTQINFYDFAGLREYLDKTYQFEHMTVVDNVAIPEFSNIEYIVFEEKFNLVELDAELFDDSAVNKNVKLEIYKLENSKFKPIVNEQPKSTTAAPLNIDQNQIILDLVRKSLKTTAQNVPPNSPPNVPPSEPPKSPPNAPPNAPPTTPTESENMSAKMEELDREMALALEAEFNNQMSFN